MTNKQVPGGQVLGEEHELEPCSFPNTCVPFPFDDSELHNRMPLYAAFGAARRPLARIKQDQQALLIKSPSPPPSPPPAIPGSCG
jgi:hypothetical protein